MIAALYIRVSTVDRGQDVRVQQEPLKSWVRRLGYEPLVYPEEGVSGARTTRPALDRLMRAVRRREVQAVAVLKLDRLGRSLEHLLQLLGEFDANGVRLLVHDMAIDTSTPHGRLFFQMVGAFAEFERTLIAERVRDGMAYARAHGTKSGRRIGRPRVNVDFCTLLNSVFQGAHPTVASQARKLGISRASLYRLMAEANYRWEAGMGWVSKSPLVQDDVSS
ncbi:MAG: recombinase family protein [Dehalococcoidia bacterium]